MGDYPMKQYNLYDDNLEQYQEQSQEQSQGQYQTSDYLDYYDISHNITDGGEGEGAYDSVVGIGFVCFLFMLAHFSGTVCCVWRNRNNQADQINQNRNPNINERLVQEREISNIEILTVKCDKELIDANSTDCCICLETFHIDDNVSLLRCGHMFHKGCIIDWLKKDFTCPLCRGSV